MVGKSNKSLQARVSQVQGKVGRPKKTHATSVTPVDCPFPPQGNDREALRGLIDQWHTHNAKTARKVKTEVHRFYYGCADPMCKFDLKYRTSNKKNSGPVADWNIIHYVPHSCKKVCRLTPYQSLRLLQL